MASLQEGPSYLSTTAGKISRFILYVSFMINHHPCVLVVLCFHSLYTAMQHLFFYTTQTGSILWRNPVHLVENECSFSSEVHDDDSGSPAVFSSGKSDLKSSKRLIEIADCDSESKSAKTDEYKAFLPDNLVHFKNRFDSGKSSLLGIQDIASQLANHESKNLNIAATSALWKEGIGFFPGFGKLVCYFN